MFSGLLPKKTTQAEEDLMPFAVWSQPCVTSLCRGSILRKHLPPRARRYTKETLETQCFRYTSCPDRYATRKTSWRSHPPPTRLRGSVSYAPASGKNNRQNTAFTCQGSAVFKNAGSGFNVLKAHL